MVNCGGALKVRKFPKSLIYFRVQSAESSVDCVTGDRGCDRDILAPEFIKDHPGESVFADDVCRDYMESTGQRAPGRNQTYGDACKAVGRYAVPEMVAVSANRAPVWL